MQPTLITRGYRATRTDEELVIHDVEIFCACTRGDFVADERWVMAAFNDALSSFRETGYDPPLHVRHHERETAATDAVKSAGTFHVTGVRPITLQKKRRSAIIVDLHVTDMDVADDILAGKLPYRSVEIFDVDEPPSIDGLALLNHEAPFLKLPMLMVSDLNDESTMTTDGTGDKVWAHTVCKAFAFKAGRCINPLSIEETDMATKKHISTASEFGAGVDPSKLPLLFESDDGPPKKKDDDDKGENAEGDDEGGGLDVGAVVKAIESGSISIADMDAILAAIQSQGSTEEPEPEAEMPAPATAPGAEAMKAQPGTHAMQMAALQGEVDALKVKDVGRDAADQCKTDVAAAMERLKDRPLGADFEAKLTAFHTAHGPEAFKAYVDSMAETFGTVPAADATGAAFTANAGTTPAVAMKYLEGGGSSADVDRAANFARQWEELSARGGMRTTLDRYVEINMSTPTEIEA